MVAVGEKLVRGEEPPAIARVWYGHLAYPARQKKRGAKISPPDLRLYFKQDANWNPDTRFRFASGFRPPWLNTTGFVGYNSTTQSWGVVQRYVYSPYGSVTILNADFSATPSGTVPMVNNLYQGMTLDAVTGLYYERYRDYSAALGRWMEQDPAQYVNGANAYQFVQSSPVGNVDAEGLWYTTVFGPLGPLLRSEPRRMRNRVRAHRNAELVQRHFWNTAHSDILHLLFPEFGNNVVAPKLQARLPRPLLHRQRT